MDASDVIRTIDRILVEDFELDAEQVVPEASLREDLDLDSLDAVDLVVALEKAFGIRIDAKVVEKMQTVGDIHAYVRGVFESGEFPAAAPEPAREAGK